MQKHVRFKLFLQGLGPTEQRELTFVKKTKMKTDPESSESDLLLKQPLSLIMLRWKHVLFNSICKSLCHLGLSSSRPTLDPI